MEGRRRSLSLSIESLLLGGLAIGSVVLSGCDAGRGLPEGPRNPNDASIDGASRSGGPQNGIPAATGPSSVASRPAGGQWAPGAPARLEISRGQHVYVPAYSHIYHGSGHTFLLAITLSVRNTSPSESIVIRLIRYHDSRGQLIREYAKGEIRLAPLATTEIFVKEEDSSGGSGASFLVEWVADRVAVSAPVVEAVMISTRSQQGLSFISPGRVIEEFQPDGEAPPSATEAP